MASTVLSGSRNPSYTNNTGQNVRIVINYMEARLADPNTGLYTPITLSWAGVSARAELLAIGRNLALYDSASNSVAFQNNSQTSTDALVANNAIGNGRGASSALPTEIMLAPNQTFSATCAVYNIVVIPEEG